MCIYVCVPVHCWIQFVVVVVVVVVFFFVLHVVLAIVVHAIDNSTTDSPLHSRHSPYSDFDYR